METFKPECYMRILSRFVAQENVSKVWEKLTELEELVGVGNIPWTELMSYPSKESLAVLAARYGQVSLLKALLMKNAPVLYFETGNLDGKRPIHEAVEHANLYCVQYLVETVGVSVNSLKRADWTPLMLACVKGNLEIVQYLLTKEADIYFRNKDGWNAFHLACREGNLDIVELLYSTEDAKAISNNGRSPLHTAALHGRLDVVQFLLQKCGYKPDALDASGHTPIENAKVAGHMEVVRLLEMVAR